MAGEGEGLLHGVGDHHHMAQRAARGHGVDGGADVVWRREKIADQHRLGARRQSLGWGKLGGSVAMAALVLDQHLREPLDDAARRQRPRQARHAHALAAAHQKVRDGEAQHEGAVHLGLHGQRRDIGHGGGAIHPDPDRMGRLPLALAHIDPVIPCRATPIDPRGGFAPDEGAELPEGLAHARPLAPVDAVHDGRRHFLGRHEKGGQSARQIQRAALMAGLGRSFGGVQKAGVHHGVSQAVRRAAR
jgi:hypothetical protein